MGTVVAKCPACRRPTSVDAANPWRPFCSERCQLLDLGAWLSERHAIPGDPVEPDTDRDGDEHGNLP